MDNIKLYVKIKCSICLGEGKAHCPYCDCDGKHFIEATEKTIKNWVNDMCGEEKEQLKELLFGTNL